MKNAMEFKTITLIHNGKMCEVAAIKYRENEPAKIIGRAPLLSAPLESELLGKRLDLAEKIINDFWEGQYFNAIDLDEWEKCEKNSAPK